MTDQMIRTTESMTEVAPEELQRLLDAQRAAQALGPIPDAATRRDRIDRFVAAVLEHAGELAEALDADFGSRPSTTITTAPRTPACAASAASISPSSTR